MKRFLMILYLLDSLVLGIITLGNCRVGETISSVAFITEQDGRLIGKIMRPVIDAIMKVFEDDHCFKAWTTFRKITGQLR